MRLSGDCRAYFFLAWTAWIAGGWALLAGSYLLRSAFSSFGLLNFYAAEAYLAMLVPFAAIGLADRACIKLYEQVWFEFTKRALGPVALDRQAVENLRAELRRIPLLRWAMPPQPREVRGQLMTTALWLPALSQPEGTPWTQRYREWIVDSICWMLLPAAILVLFFADARWALPLGLSLLGLGLLQSGWSLLRLAARRQAILDYFTAWMAPGRADGVDKAGESG